MSQFDVFENSGRLKSSIPFILDVQSDLVSGVLSTRVVVPFYKAALIKKAALKLHLPVVIKGQKCIGLFDELASVQVNDLGYRVGNLSAVYGRECRVALDVLFFNQP